jgi:heme/copper-type cytochrome/quinol oxidase subunit 2
MNGGQRIGLLVAALAVLAVALFVLSPGDTKDDTASTTTPQASTPSATATDATAPAAPPRPQFTVIRVSNGKPVGGVRTINVTSGERARIEVRSSDTSDEVHLHGYDLKRDLHAGGRVRFSFKADAEGIFEMELEGSGTQIAKIEVQPR